MAKPAHALFGRRHLPSPNTATAKPACHSRCIEASHPVPDATSLAAGARLLAEVANAPQGSHLLLLVSGGASALAEAPHPGVTLSDITGAEPRPSGLGSGHRHDERHPHPLFQIKGGGLLAQFRGSRVTVLAISDTRGDRIETIGSGIGLCLPAPA